MIDGNVPEVDVDELMERIRKEIRRREPVCCETDLPACHCPSGDEIRRSYQPDSLHIDCQPGSTLFIPKDDGYHVNDFLQYHDQEFVKNAYRGILCREADPAGYHHYLEKLRQGAMTKVEVLGRLRYAREGRSKSVKVRGLLGPFAAHTSFRIPVLGYLLRLLTGLLQLPTIIKNIQLLDSHAQRQFVELRDHLNRNAGAVHSKFDEMMGCLSSMESVCSEKADRTELHASLEELQRLRVDQSALRTSIEDLRGSKADRTELEASLETVRSLGANQAELRTSLEALRSSKADRTELEASLETVRSLGVNQAELRTSLEDLRGSKADRTELEASLEMVRSLGVNQAELRTSFEDLRGSKADRVELEEITNQKVDQNVISVVHDELADIHRQIRDHRRNIVDLQRRITLLLEETRRCLPEQISCEHLQNVITEEDHMLDAMYVAFEDVFRGRREDIKERQRVYLPYIEQVEAGTIEAPVLDLGCGRGEWLEVLRDQGLHGRGVDKNRILVEECRERGLDAIEADAITYLRGLPDVSLMAVTGFHIIEHLCLREMINLLDETIRVLRPGGILILETPNPQNVLVGSFTFYLDPTHRNPLPSPMMRFMAEIRGFGNVTIVNLNPSPESFPTSGSVCTDIISDYFYGPRDYALIGWKL